MCPSPSKNTPKNQARESEQKRSCWYKIKTFIAELKFIANQLGIKCEGKKGYDENHSHTKIFKKPQS